MRLLRPVRSRPPLWLMVCEQVALAAHVLGLHVANVIFMGMGSKPLDPFSLRTSCSSRRVP